MRVTPEGLMRSFRCFSVLVEADRSFWYNPLSIKTDKKYRKVKSEIQDSGKTMKEVKEECMICKAPLEYLNEDIEMECELCHKKEKSKTRCVNGHYVCNECHIQGVDSLIGMCMNEESKNPALILDKMMRMPFCHMHGPEHHIMVGMAQPTEMQAEISI